MVDCPICGQPVQQININDHIDSGCQSYVDTDNTPSTSGPASGKVQKNGSFSNFFQKTQPSASRANVSKDSAAEEQPPEAPAGLLSGVDNKESNAAADAGSAQSQQPPASSNGLKRPLQDDTQNDGAQDRHESLPDPIPTQPLPSAKRPKLDPISAAAPLAERMRPRSLDDVCGQTLVGDSGLLRSLIELNRVPSMILWGGPGTGKTTIARLVARHSGARFIEINSTSSGVGECKRIFQEARNELSLSRRKTIVFCDEIHRFSKSQQDVFLAPVEAGIITLIGATTENPSFKVINALMSRCRTFTLAPLTEESVQQILRRALDLISSSTEPPTPPPPLIDEAHLKYLATAASGDARTALNLLELAHSLNTQHPELTLAELKKALTTTLLHDRTGDSHYNLISALHKSVRGSDANAALYYLARMLSGGEDPLYIARRLIVIASEDIGIADNSMLPLAIAAYTAVEKVGLPEARINLGHAVTALALSRKSVRAYRGLSAAEKALREPGAQSAQVPLHLRNAPTGLLKDMGCGAEYKYNPDYVDGKVKQEYLPEELRGREFLGERDLGETVDPDLTDDGATGEHGEIEEEGRDAASDETGHAAEKDEEETMPEAIDEAGPEAGRVTLDDQAGALISEGDWE